MTTQTFLLLASLILTQGLGDIFLSRGMKDFGAVTLHFATVPVLLGYLFTCPWIYLGVGSLVLSLVIYLTAISRLDLSYVLPIQAFTYVVNAILARFLLGEEIGLSRGFSTLLITGGVLIVGLSEGGLSTVGSPPKIPKKTRNFPLFIAPLGLAISKSWLAIFLVAIADASGDILLALGMKQVGRVGRSSWQEIKSLIWRVVSSPAIIGGICCQAIAFASFITVLSWADISFVRPATALTYLFSLLGAKFLLKETLTREKLIGITFVGCGILFHR